MEGASQFIRQQAHYPDFRGFVAVHRGTVIGMAFGTKSEPGQWWHDRVLAQLGGDPQALRDAWVVTELAVLEEWQGHGIGSSLLDALLKSQPYPRALLSTEVGNDRARGMYQRRGWTYLHPGFVFQEGEQPYVVMAREL